MIWKNKRTLAKQQVLLFSLFFIILCGLVLLSLMYGAVEVSFSTVKEAFLSFDGQNQFHQIIRNTRFPRIIGGVLVGSSLAMSGALMQGVIQNSLADSGLLGINSGAALGLALAFLFFPQHHYWLTLLCSFIGAAVNVSFIYLISRTAIMNIGPIRLILAGAGINAFCISLSQAIALQFGLNRDLTFWSMGGINTLSWQQLKLVFPFFVVGLFLSLYMSSAITVLRFGDDTATNLGISPENIRLVVGIIVLVLSGISVAIAGSISFIGLIVPHMMRKVVGESYRKLVPFSALGGSILVVIADALARTLHPPFEIPFGIVIALIGVPFSLYFFRKGDLSL